VAGADDHAELPERSATGAYLQMYDWDACLFSVYGHLFGVEGLPFSVVSNFVALQEADGYVPRTVSPGRTWDRGDMCKPFLCQALLRELERTDWARLEDAVALMPALDLFLQWYCKNRQHESGLFMWRNVLESGCDDSYALLFPQEAAKDEDQTSVAYPDGRMLAADLNGYLFAEFRAYAKIAERAGLIEKSLEYFDLSIALAAKIEERLWDASLSLYVNVDSLTGKPAQLRSWTGLVPALLGVSSPARIERVLRNNVLVAEHFFAPFGVPSMAISEPLCNQAPRGLYGRAIVCNWNGPVWILPNVLVVRTLLSCGMKKEAREIAHRVLSAMVSDLKVNGVLHENYNAFTGCGLWAPRFLSFNMMAVELIDALQCRPYCVRRLPTKRRYSTST
jgi:putative isomerase